jgi:hypothetical protein
VLIARGTNGTPAWCSAWARDEPSSACTPGQLVRISTDDTPPRLRGRDRVRRRRRGGSHRRPAAACRGPSMGRTITGCASSSCTAGKVRVPNTGRPGSPAGLRAAGQPRPVPRAAGLRRARAPTAGGSPSAPSWDASRRARTTSASSWRTRWAACCGCARRPTSRPRGAWIASPWSARRAPARPCPSWPASIRPAPSARPSRPPPARRAWCAPMTTRTAPGRTRRATGRNRWG